MRSVHVRFIAALSILALVMFPSLSLAQALADRVPADSIVYVGWRGSQSLGAGYDRSNLKAFLAESQIPQFCDEFLPKLADRISREDKDAAQAISVFRAVAGPMWRHPSAFFFAGVDLSDPNMPKPHLGLISQAGNEAAELQAQVKALLQQAGEPPIPVRIVRVGDLVALGYEKGEDAIAGGAGGGKGLAGDADFTSALGQVSKDAVVTGYINTEKALALADQIVAKHGPQEAQQLWPKVKEALGVAGVKRVIFSQGFAGKEWETRAFIAAPEPRSGFVGGFFNAKPLTDDIYRTIPQNVTMAGAAYFDFAGLISGIRTAAGQVDPNAGQIVNEVLSQVSQTVGIDVEKDFLGALGDQWAYYVDPSVVGRGLIGVTIVNHLKDPAKFEQSLTKLEGFANATIAQQMQNEKDKVTIAFRETTVGNLTVHYLAVPIVSPAWAVKDGNLYLSLYPQVTVAAAEHVAHKGKTILDNQSFTKLREQLAGGSANSMQFVDLPQLAPNSYGIWVAISRLSGFGDLFGVQSPPMLLPNLNKVMPLLSPAGQVTWTDAQGAHLRAIEPFPASGLMAGDPTAMGPAAPAMMVSILLPALNRAREQANRVKSASNLRQIGLANLLYANNQKNGALAPDLGTLLRTQDLSVHVFTNPRCNSAVPPNIANAGQQEQAAWVDQNADYVYFGRGKKNTMGPDEVLAAEKPETVTEGVNILFGDGHVEFIPMDRAIQMIAKAMPDSPRKGRRGQ
jgi:prepilin-type processing-associated H-X9-DG protein